MIFQNFPWEHFQEIHAEHLTKLMRHHHQQFYMHLEGHSPTINLFPTFQWEHPKNTVWLLPMTKGLFLTRFWTWFLRIFSLTWTLFNSPLISLICFRMEEFSLWRFRFCESKSALVRSHFVSVQLLKWTKRYARSRSCLNQERILQEFEIPI